MVEDEADDKRERNGRREAIQGLMGRVKRSRILEADVIITLGDTKGVQSNGREYGW